MYIYIASPYTHPNPEVRRARAEASFDAALKLMAMGHWPHCPLWTHYLERRAIERGFPSDTETWMNLDFAWLARCDAILVLARPGESKGVDREVKWATDHKLHLFTAVEQITNAT